jgi:NADP-dependent 3-hydroxy acid dehydrogenase YdfG
MLCGFMLKYIVYCETSLGIGRTLAKALYAAGAEMHGISKTSANLESLKSECPNLHTYCVDMSDWTKLREVVDALPVMDGLVNNAGVSKGADFVDATPEQFDWYVDFGKKSNFSTLIVYMSGTGDPPWSA